MKKLILSLAFILTLFAISNAQSKSNHVDRATIDRDIKEAMKEVQIALDEIVIPDISKDVEFALKEAKRAIEEIDMEEIKRALPTQQEMEHYKDLVKDAVKEVEEIDFSAISEMLQELGELFEVKESIKEKSQ